MKRWHAVVLALVLLTAPVLTYAATSTYFASSGSAIGSQSDTVVRFGSDTTVDSGSPFPDADTVEVQNTSFSSPGPASVTVDSFGDPIQLSSIQTNGSDLRINKSTDGTRAVIVSGQSDAFDIHQVNLSRDDDQTDIAYDSLNDAPEIEFDTELNEDESVVAIDRDTDTVIGSAFADSSGTVLFSNLESGAHDVNFERGPSILRVYNETAPSQLVDDDATLRIRFFDGDSEEVIERDITDGTATLQGVPQDDEVIVTVREESGNYTYRRIILDSLYQQQDIYLLHQSQPNIRVAFQLNDKTGEFRPSETRLFVEKPITKDYDSDGTNETRYETVVGDRFGADGRFPAVIQPSERYRLRVKNDDGQTRVLGAYSAAERGIVEIPIGQIQFQGRGSGEASFAASMFEQSGDRYVRIQYRDSLNATESLDLEIVGTDNASTIRPNTTESGPFGVYTETYKLPNGEPDDATYEVRYHADRRGEPDMGATRFVGDVPEIAKSMNIDPQVLSLLGWVMLVGISGGVVLIDDRLAALVSVAVATGLSVIGLLQIPTVALGVSGGIAILYNLGRIR